MALQRTTEGRTGQHSYSRESAEPFAIRQRQAEFAAQPPNVQHETIKRVVLLLRQELRNAEFRNRPSELRRTAPAVYGIRVEDL